jgi:exodeoxyribonuclease V alpha subunit
MPRAPLDHLERLRRLNGQPADRNARELVGTVAAVLWTAPDSSAVIARLHGGQVVKGPLAEEDGAGEGGAYDVFARGVAYRFLGQWQEHPKHGMQFAFSTYIQDAPHSRPGVLKYLQDEAPNIGRVRAERLWETFGKDAVAVLRAEPARVVAAGILNAEQANEAAEALRAASALEKTKIDLFSLFAGRGFPGTLIRACMDEWGARAAEAVRRNPFALLVNEMPGAGFKRCDRLYLDLGFPADRLKRQMLCGWHALREDTTGHTWFRMGYAHAAIERAVSSSNVNPQRAVELGVRGGWLSTHESLAGSGYLWIAEAEKARAERSLAANVQRLLGPCVTSWPDHLPLDSFLSDHQRERLLAALARPVGILDGSPGTGKTRCAVALIRLIVQRWGLEAVAVCAPTGKAAVRITGVLRGDGIALDATTIHRLLEISRNGRDGRGWGFKRNRGNPLPHRFIVVDEASMLDTTVASNLFEALAGGTHVLLVGDTGQLPPVQHGAPLRDLIAAGVPCGTLSEIQRQGGEPNTIVQACADIKAGRRFATVDRYDPARGHNLRLVEVPADSPAQAVEVLLALVRQFQAGGKFDPVWDVQVLSAMNTASEVARVPLNRVLQGELNPAGRAAAPNPFRISDKIICLKNSWMKRVELVRGYPPGEADSYRDAEWNRGGGKPIDETSPEVFLANGDVGRVVAVAPKLTVARFDAPERLIKIPMGKPREDDQEKGTEIKGGGCDFGLAYAITVHKAQGSEWPVVVVIADRLGQMVCSRNWWYTAISRATKLGIIVGERGLVERQCKRESLSRRKTFLEELLQA